MSRVPDFATLPAGTAEPAAELPMPLLVWVWNVKSFNLTDIADRAAGMRAALAAQRQAMRAARATPDDLRYKTNRDNLSEVGFVLETRSNTAIQAATALAEVLNAKVRTPGATLAVPYAASTINLGGGPNTQENIAVVCRNCTLGTIAATGGLAIGLADTDFQLMARFANHLYTDNLGTRRSGRARTLRTYRYSPYGDDFEESGEEARIIGRIHNTDDFREIIRAMLRGDGTGWFRGVAAVAVQRGGDELTRLLVTHMPSPAAFKPYGQKMNMLYYYLLIRSQALALNASLMIGDFNIYQNLDESPGSTLNLWDNDALVAAVQHWGAVRDLTKIWNLGGTTGPTSQLDKVLINTRAPGVAAVSRVQLIDRAYARGFAGADGISDHHGLYILIE